MPFSTFRLVSNLFSPVVLLAGLAGLCEWLVHLDLMPVTHHPALLPAYDLLKAVVLRFLAGCLALAAMLLLGRGMWRLHGWRHGRGERCPDCSGPCVLCHGRHGLRWRCLACGARRDIHY
ncbi:hypothetical protein GCM10027202_18590 [Microvirgula curvata]|uniref:hypothetical protein n=1 Tax=Microvirgula aerodenitrificans TaxID=57480 RepID=UPI00248F3936|nr:hypothetical protein [Microvirgula aerodenitrificans]